MSVTEPQGTAGGLNAITTIDSVLNTDGHTNVTSQLNLVDFQTTSTVDIPNPPYPPFVAFVFSYDMDSFQPYLDALRASGGSVSMPVNYTLDDWDAVYSYLGLTYTPPS